MPIHRRMQQHDRKLRSVRRTDLRADLLFPKRLPRVRQHVPEVAEIQGQSTEFELIEHHTVIIQYMDALQRFLESCIVCPGHILYICIIFRPTRATHDSGFLPQPCLMVSDGIVGRIALPDGLQKAAAHLDTVLVSMACPWPDLMTTDEVTADQYELWMLCVDRFQQALIILSELNLMKIREENEAMRPSDTTGTEAVSFRHQYTSFVL